LARLLSNHQHSRRFLLDQQQITHQDDFTLEYPRRSDLQQTQRFGGVRPVTTPVLFAVCNEICCMVAGLVLLLGMSVFAVHCGKAIRRHLLISTTRFARIEDLKPGYCKTQGVAVPLDELIQSPMTQTECILFHFTVEHEIMKKVKAATGRYAYRPEWVQILEVSRAIDCQLDDETGQVTIDLLDAELVMQNRPQLICHGLGDSPRKLERTMRRDYAEIAEQFGDSKLRFKESIICEGDEVFVVGTLRKKKGKEQLRFTKGDNPLIVSDGHEGSVTRQYLGKAVMFALGTVILLLVGGAMTVGGIRALVKPASKEQVATAPTTSGTTPSNTEPALEPIPAALKRTKSQQAAERIAGANQLAALTPVDPYRREVLAALNHMIQFDVDPSVKQAAQLAKDRWSVVVKPPPPR